MVVILDIFYRVVKDYMWYYKSISRKKNANKY